MKPTSQPLMRPIQTKPDPQVVQNPATIQLVKAALQASNRPGTHLARMFGPK